MKTKFSEHIYKKIVLENLLDSKIILDTNVVLNLYRYNDLNREKFLKILSKLEKQLYLPYKVVEEFFKNKKKVLEDKIKNKDEAQEIIKKAYSDIENINLCKYNKELKFKLEDLKNQTLTIIDEEGKKEKITEDDILKEDKILTKLFDIFDNKINDEFSEECLNEIKDEGKKRYEKQIPPGYKDKKKSEKGECCYGDLIIWKEMIDISKKFEKNIIFISDDAKKDWVEIYCKMPISPRKELLKEFKKETNGKEFYMLKSKDFVEIVSKEMEIDDAENLTAEIDGIEEEMKKQEIKDKKQNNDLLSLGDEKIYQDLKIKFFDNGLIDKLGDFIFGKQHDIHYFDFDNGWDSSDYIEYNIDKDPYYMFKDEELEKLRIEFCENYSRCMYLLSMNYFPSEQRDDTLITTWRHKDNVGEEFEKVKIKAVWAFKTLLRECYKKTSDKIR